MPEGKFSRDGNPLWGDDASYGGGGRLSWGWVAVSLETLSLEASWGRLRGSNLANKYRHPVIAFKSLAGCFVHGRTSISWQIFELGSWCLDVRDGKSLHCSVLLWVRVGSWGSVARSAVFFQCSVWPTKYAMMRISHHLTTINRYFDAPYMIPSALSTGLHFSFWGQITASVLIDWRLSFHRIKTSGWSRPSVCSVRAC